MFRRAELPGVRTHRFAIHFHHGALLLSDCGHLLTLRQSPCLARRRRAHGGEDSTTRAMAVSRYFGRKLGAAKWQVQSVRSVPPGPGCPLPTRDNHIGSSTALRTLFQTHSDPAIFEMTTQDRYIRVLVPSP